MMFNLSACDIRQIPRPRNDDHNKTVNISRKKHQRLRTEEGDEQENTVLMRGKRVRKNKKDALLGDKKIHQRYGRSNFPNHSRFITLKLTNDSHKRSRLGLPLPFMRGNGLNKPGEIGLLAKEGRKLMVSLLQDSRGRMSLGKGWKDFVLENGLQIDESFTLELIWKDSTPMLRLSSSGTDSECDKRHGKFCSLACEEESVYVEPSNGTSDKNGKNNIEDREYSSLEIQNQVLTLTLTPEDVKDCKLILPSEFIRAYGIDKLGKISILGRANMKWWGYRSSRDGIIAVGIGWGKFCKANGVKTGNLFTLEFIYEEVDTTPVFRICPKSGD